MRASSPSSDNIGHPTRAVSYSSQVALPFTHLKIATGVAVDTAGDLYVTDYYTNEVWKLAAGAGAPTVLPFPALKNPGGVAVDSTGNLYVADSINDRVLKLPVG